MLPLEPKETIGAREFFFLPNYFYFVDFQNISTSGGCTFQTGVNLKSSNIKCNHFLLLLLLFLILLI